MYKNSMEKNSNFLLVICFLLLSFTPFLFSACIGEFIAPIKVQNNTEETLTIYIDGVRIGNVASGEEIRNDIIWITARFVIEAKNVQGELVYSQEFTFDEMKDDISWKVVIPPLGNGSTSSDNVTTDNIPAK